MMRSSWGIGQVTLELRIALEQRRVVITRDKDFGTLAVLHGQSHRGIVRLIELPPTLELRLCSLVLGQHAGNLDRGCLITVEHHRIRVREP